VTFSKDGTRSLVITNKATAQVWDLETGIRAALLQGHDELIAQAVFSPTGDTVLTASYDRTVRLWEAATGKQLAILRGRRGTIGKIVAYAPQGHRILVAAEDNILSALWIGATPKQVIHRAHAKLPTTMTADQERRFYITMGGRAT
jgi:WD40 repeat protein